MSHDLVIRGGTVVNGTGAPRRVGDVAIDLGVVTAIGEVTDPGREEVDATGLLVTPGFVDIHTHLDAQLWWDPHATPSSWHGITSVVVGNCGVTFAPCRPGDAPYLAAMMESVEDIPAAAVLASLPWTWETYGEYLDALRATPLGLNVGGLVGHCALRYHAMGEASLGDSAAADAELHAMRAAVAEALGAGALGLSVSRTLLHRVPGGGKVPGTFAPMAELHALADVLGDAGRGVFEIVTDLLEEDGSTVERSLGEVRELAELSMRTGRPVTFSLAQSRHSPDFFRAVLALTASLRAAGADLRPQTTVRAIGIVYTLASRTPYDKYPSWRALRTLPLDERLARIANSAVRAEMLAEANSAPLPIDLDHVLVFPPGPARYDLGPDDSLGGHARRRQMSAPEVFLDLCLESAGKQVFSWSRFNPHHEAVEEMLRDNATLVGLADAGAHVGMIMDASQPSYLLSYWARDRGVLTVEEAVRRLTSDPASVFGIEARGVLAPGMAADVNLIDLDALALDHPTFGHDGPQGSGRLVQGATGYRATYVNGVPVTRDGTATGALTGVVL